MSRRKYNSVNILPWLTARTDGTSRCFVSFDETLHLSKQLQALSTGAQRTYLCMTQESRGKRAFTFPLATARRYGISKNTLTRNVAELAAADFISVGSGKNTRQPNEYCFSFGWKNRTGTNEQL